jgi:hypothetical protein
LAQALGLEKLPLIKFRGIRQAKAGQEIIPVERHRFGQALKTGGAKRLSRVIVRLNRCQTMPEAGHIQP